MDVAAEGLDDRHDELENPGNGGGIRRRRRGGHVGFGLGSSGRDLFDRNGSETRDMCECVGRWIGFLGCCRLCEEEGDGESRKMEDGSQGGK